MLEITPKPALTPHMGALPLPLHILALLSLLMLELVLNGVSTTRGFRGERKTFRSLLFLLGLEPVDVILPEES